MIRELSTSQGETLKTCWTLWQANGRRSFKLGREYSGRVKSLIARDLLVRYCHGRRLVGYTMTSLGESIANLRFGASTPTMKRHMRRLAGRRDEPDDEVSTAPSRDDGKPGGPGEGASTSSPLPVGPPGAVPFPLARLCLDVKMDLNMEVPRGLADQISRIFADWSDGRKPFSVEMVERGLTEVVASAAYHAIESELRKRYGNEMVPTGRGSETSKACIEADKLTQGLRVRIRENVECLTVSESEP